MGNKSRNLYSQHKLLKHLDRIDTWLKGGISYPVYVDFDLTNKCNNRCPLCITSYKGNAIVEFEKAKNIISQLNEVNVKAITFGGGGEPSCHPNLSDLIRFVKEKNMEVATFSNCYNLSNKLIGDIVECCTWMRVSLDADGPKLYKITHGMNEKAFYQVVDNMKKLVDERRKIKSKIVIGATYLLGPHTAKGIYNATKLVKELGMDYIRFRPFLIQSKRNFTKKEEKEIFDELERCKELDDEKFYSSYPKDRCLSEPEVMKRNYDKCYVPNFIVSITSDLKMYPCCVFKNDRRYCIGDLTKKSFKEIWNSEERRKILEKIVLEECPNPCQFEGHNKLLNRIKVRGYGEFLDVAKKEIAHSNFL